MPCNHGYTQDYHNIADKMVKNLCQHTKSNLGDIKSHLDCLEKQSEIFHKDDKAKAQFLGLNILYCHYDYHEDFLKAVKGSKSMDTDDFVSSMQFVNCCGSIKRNKLERARESLEEEKQSNFCGDEICERTAFYYKASASCYLQQAWTSSGDIKAHYKTQARTNFQSCKDSFEELSKKNPDCMYLKTLYLVSSINLIFLQLKLCWFLFDKNSAIHRFDTHKCPLEDLPNAEGLINRVEEDVTSLEEGSLWEHYVCHKLCRVKFFFQCRHIQMDKSKCDKQRAIGLAQETLHRIKTEYPGNVQDTDCDMFTELIEHLKEQTHFLTTKSVLNRQRNFSEQLSIDGDMLSNEERLSDLTGLSSDLVDSSYSDRC